MISQSEYHHGFYDLIFALYLAKNNAIIRDFFLTDPERIGVLLSSSIFEAHTRTILMTYDQIRERWRIGIDQQKLFLFKNMVSNK